jgi:hypothetical protein
VNEGQSVQIGLFEAALRDVELSMGLRVESVFLEGGGLQLLNHPFRAIAADPGKIRVVVLESALTDYVAKSPPWGMKNIRVTIADDRLYLDAVKNVLVDLKVHAVCKLRIENESSVFVDLEAVDVVGAGITQLVQSAIDKLNPIINTDMLPFPAKLKQIDLSHGKLTLLGEISPPE